MIAPQIHINVIFPVANLAFEGDSISVAWSTSQGQLLYRSTALGVADENSPWEEIFSCEGRPYEFESRSSMPYFDIIFSQSLLEFLSHIFSQSLFEILSYVIRTSI